MSAGTISIWYLDDGTIILLIFEHYGNVSVARAQYICIGHGARSRFCSVRSEMKSTVGPRATVAHILNQMTDLGPQFGLYLNHSKCELFWPSGDATFPEFPPDILRLEDGVSLLGSPYGVPVTSLSPPLPSWLTELPSFNPRSPISMILKWLFTY